MIFLYQPHNSNLSAFSPPVKSACLPLKQFTALNETRPPFVLYHVALPRSLYYVFVCSFFVVTIFVLNLFFELIFYYTQPMHVTILDILNNPEMTALLGK